MGLDSVIFRADASCSIGAGHVMRCLALASALRQQGAEVRFVSQECPGDLRGRIAGAGFSVDALPANTSPEQDARRTRVVIEAWRRRPDWLVVDHYGLDYRWEEALRPAVEKILAIDDVADRRHDCDIILDQNFHENMELRYDRLVPTRCIRALGPQFALLREEFYAARKSLRERAPGVSRLFVSFGGADPTNETAKTLEALSKPSFEHLAVDVVIGGQSLNSESLITRYEDDTRFQFHRSPENVAALMAAADLAIGAGGSMTWERCFLGVPSVVIVVAQNQADTTLALHRAGVLKSLGWHAKVDVDDIVTALVGLMEDRSARERLQERSLALMGGEEITRMKILNLMIGSDRE